MDVLDLNIRPLRATDAGAVAALNESLGYPAGTDEVRARIQHLRGRNDRVALGAVLQEVVVGWVDAAVEHHLQSEPVVTIGGLIVREDMRGKRIGQKLCGAVEEWAKQAGILTVRVRSQQKRVDAHRFYLRDGYINVKMSAVFEKRLVPQA